MGRLSHLESLQLNQNEIAYLPPGCLSNESLTALILSNNQLSHVPKLVGRSLRAARQQAGTRGLPIQSFHLSLFP